MIFFTPVVTTLVGGGDRVALPLSPALRAHRTTRSPRLGYLPIDWLGDPHWAMPAIILFAVWKNFGYNMLIFVAGLQSIPEDLYEAARIDGAGGWARFVTSRCRRWPRPSCSWASSR